MRIGAGNFHALRHTWRLLNPTAGAVALAFWSHKVCRWLVPLALAAAQIAAAMLASEPLYGVAAAMGGLLVLLALLDFLRSPGTILRAGKHPLLLYLDERRAPFGLIAFVRGPSRSSGHRLHGPLRRR